MATSVISSKQVGIEIVERTLLTPGPASAEPRHSYKPIITTRANVKAQSGTSEYAALVIDGTAVSHTFTIRYTTIPIDIRNRIRDARGKLYQVLKVVNVDERNREIRIFASAIGHEDIRASE